MTSRSRRLSHALTEMSVVAVIDLANNPYIGNGDCLSCLQSIYTPLPSRANVWPRETGDCTVLLLNETWLWGGET